MRFKFVFDGDEEYLTELENIDFLKMDTENDRWYLHQKDGQVVDVTCFVMFEGNTFCCSYEDGSQEGYTYVLKRPNGASLKYPAEDVIVVQNRTVDLSDPEELEALEDDISLGYVDKTTKNLIGVSKYKTDWEEEDYVFDADDTIICFELSE